jgi:M6 family metalloprotease-like protein
MHHQGRYVYAQRDAKGALAPTTLAVGGGNPDAAGLAKRILPAPESIQQQAAALMSGMAPSAVVAPGAATLKNLVVLCLFSNHTAGVQTRNASDYDVLLNKVGGDPVLAPTGSVRDYYTEASYGKLVINSTILAWVTLPNSEAYYGNGQSGLGSYPQNAQRMVEDALNLVGPLVDFSQFDTNNDGWVDAITIIHSGYGAETGGGAGNWIWSHKWALRTPWVSADRNTNSVNVKVYNYHTEPALWGTSGNAITHIGVICHETGHFLGLPDLYDIDYSGSGIGSYCLMANSWGFDGTAMHPPHFSAWCKATLGWVTPTVIAPGASVTAPQVETSPTIFRIDRGFPANEYLLVENREPVGFESDMPQGGLAVWHIDETKATANNRDNAQEGYPGQAGWPQNGTHYRVALLQADGRYDLEHGVGRGDVGDLYRSGGQTAVGHSTVPNTDTYQGGVVNPTWNRIAQVSAPGSSMTFSLIDEGPPLLRFSRSGSSLVLSWPVSSAGYVLQSCTNLAGKPAWAPTSQQALVVGDQNSVTMPATKAREFFRLAHP